MKKGVYSASSHTLHVFLNIILFLNFWQMKFFLKLYTILSANCRSLYNYDGHVPMSLKPFAN